MGCFNLYGCISQLPITGNDRVAGILCRISSDLDNSFKISYVDNIKLLPMCPIIYGTYDEYGSMIPDKSMTTDILEKFFDRNIQLIIDTFSRMTYLCWDEPNEKILKPLIGKRDWSKPRTVKNFGKEKEEPFRYYMNRYCIVFEHEHIVRKIIESNNDMMKELTRFDNSPESNWDEMYDIQYNLCVEYGLNKYDAQYKSEFYRDLNYCSILFPLQNNNNFRGPYKYEYMMDLFKNYPDMFEHVFNKDFKKEYLDTLKFFNVIMLSNLNMNINRSIGQQYINRNLWKSLMDSYKEVIDRKHE